MFQNEKSTIPYRSHDEIEIILTLSSDIRYDPVWKSGLYRTMLRITATGVGHYRRVHQYLVTVIWSSISYVPSFL